MNIRRTIATILTAATLISLSGCNSETENILTPISTVLTEFNDNTLLDEIITINSNCQINDSDFIKSIIRLEEYINVIAEISKLNIPESQPVTAEIIDEFSTMSLEQIYNQIEKHQIALGSGTEIINREAGLSYLAQEYEQWVISNGLNLSKQLLTKAIEASTIEATNLTPDYNQYNISKRIFFQGEQPSIYIDVNYKANGLTTTYVINEDSKALSTILENYCEIDLLLEDENPDYAQISKSCINALNSVKLLIASGVTIEDENILTSEKTPSEAKRLILKN